MTTAGAMEGERILQQIQTKLQDEFGIRFHAWWVQQCLAHLAATIDPLQSPLDVLYAAVRSYAIKADYHGIVESGCLPPDIADWQAERPLTFLPAPERTTAILQIADLVDCAKSAQSQLYQIEDMTSGRDMADLDDAANDGATDNAGEPQGASAPPPPGQARLFPQTSSKRMLILTLTDGVHLVSAFEFEKIPALPADVAIGTKVRLRAGVLVGLGMLMLTPAHLELLPNVPLLHTSIEQLRYRLQRILGLEATLPAGPVVAQTEPTLAAGQTNAHRADVRPPQQPSHHPRDEQRAVAAIIPPPPAVVVERAAAPGFEDDDDVLFNDLTSQEPVAGPPPPPLPQSTRPPILSTSDAIMTPPIFQMGTARRTQETPLPAALRTQQQHGLHHHRHHSETTDTDTVQREASRQSDQTTPIKQPDVIALTADFRVKSATMISCEVVEVPWGTSIAALLDVVHDKGQAYLLLGEKFIIQLLEEMDPEAETFTTDSLVQFQRLIHSFRGLFRCRQNTGLSSHPLAGKTLWQIIDITSISNALSTNVRKVVFQVDLQIDKLTDVPLINSRCHIKWTLRNLYNNQKAYTASTVVRDHECHWTNDFRLQATLLIGHHGVLEPCELIVRVRREADTASTFEQIGFIEVDLAEYAAGEAITRRYLLQESKMNSHLQITLRMRLLKGDPMFKVPDAKRRQIGYHDVLAENDKIKDDSSSFIPSAKADASKFQNDILDTCEDPICADAANALVDEIFESVALPVSVPLG